MTHTFPFAAIAGQDEMRRAILLAAVDPSLGGVMVFGDRGTGKSTAVRAIADVLPEIAVVDGCAYNCAPGAVSLNCAQCASKPADELATQMRPVPVVDLPLGATEDRVVGALDIERALSRGEKAFEPGLLASAHRGFLYIDEINLLEDHLIDLLLDVAVSKTNIVEREGISVRHPAAFVLVGSGNPEEGELRPQLLDRFALSVEVTTPRDVDTRVTIIKRRTSFEHDPAAFIATFSKETARLRDQVAAARARLGDITVSDAVLASAAELCLALGTDGLRGELTLIKAAKALAALDDQP
ncbi:MAG: ATP-binding protein, partial [Pseudomonadota bacterium]